MTTTAVDEPSSTSAGVHVAPSPFSRELRIEFTQRVAGPVRVEALDIQGRLVRTVASVQFGPGAHTLTWNGEDDRGFTVRSGIYLVCVHSTEATRVLRALAIR